MWVRIPPPLLMTENIEALTSPPTVGQTYLVPCILGDNALPGLTHLPRRVWPVIRPPHEDSKYLPKTRTVWKEVNGEMVDELEVYYEHDPASPHHYHIDPRFCPDGFFTTWEQDHSDYHNIITAAGDLEWRELTCVREMPTQRLFTGFGKQFVDDHVNKMVKCARCPHKGTLLNSVPTIDGVRTCPAHGLKFDQSGRCITKWTE